MARNTNFDLTADQRKAASLAAAGLARFQYGDVVTLDFTKRDGTESTMTGHVVNFVGEGSTEVVVLKTDKGHRSANLWSIKSVR